MVKRKPHGRLCGGFYILTYTSTELSYNRVRYCDHRCNGSVDIRAIVREGWEKRQPIPTFPKGRRPKDSLIYLSYLFNLRCTCITPQL